MKARRHYEQPTQQVVALPMKNQLLAGSNGTGSFYSDPTEEDME